MIHFMQLLNWYNVEMYAKIETERFLFIHTNQIKLIAENYIHFPDVLRNDEGIQNLKYPGRYKSKKTDLTSYVFKLTEDSFSYVW